MEAGGRELELAREEHAKLQHHVGELHALLHRVLTHLQQVAGTPAELLASLASSLSPSAAASASSSSTSTSTSANDEGRPTTREEEEERHRAGKEEELRRVAEEEARPVEKVTKRGSWSVQKGTAGGCFNSNKWRRNPQYFLRTQGTTKVEIALEQLCENEADCVPIGFYLLKTDGTGRKVFSSPTKLVVAKTTFINKPHVSLILELGAGGENEEGQFVIIPCTFEADTEANFALTVISQGKPFFLESCSNPKRMWKSEIGIKGEWKGDTAGGCKNHRSFYNNPQYLLSVKEDNTAVSVLLEKIGADPKFDVLGLYICECDDPVDKKVVAVDGTVARSPLSSPDDGDYVIFPCTFDPSFESEFLLTVFSTQSISLRELGSTSSLGVEGIWEGESAGGCMNHTTWRNNPQFFLTVKESTPITIKMRHDLNATTSIGFYILSSVDGGRPLLAKKEVLVAKSGFWEAPEVSKAFDLKASKNPYVIVPCTFTPDVETTFSLSLYPSKGAESIELRPADDVLQKHVAHGEWKSLTAGGCLNYGMWRNNPQYRLMGKKSEKVTLFLGQQLPEDKSTVLKSIGFYVYESPNPGERLISTKGLGVKCKGKFRKQKEVAAELDLEGGKEYVIIPTTFRPNHETQYTLNVFSRISDNLSLSLLPDSARNLVVGMWEEGTSGGCMNHPTFMENPHYSLSTDKECEVTLLLVQELPPDDLPFPAIGCYVTKGNEWGFPVVEAEGDIIKKTPFENGQDIEMSLRVGPDAHPWIVTPCTYEAGVKGSFYMRLFAKPSDLAHIRFHEVDYAPYIRHINGEPEPKLDSKPAEATPAETTKAEPEPATKPEREPEPVNAPEPDVPATPEPPKDNQEPAKPVQGSPATETPEPPKPVANKEEGKSKPELPVKVCPEEVKCPGCGMMFDPYNLMVIDHPAKPILAKTPAPPQQPAPAPKPAPPSPAPPPPANVVVTQEEPMYSSLLDSLGMAKLKSAKDRVLPPPPPKMGFLPFNMEKIVARRAAIEGESDDEEEELDEEWLAD